MFLFCFMSDSANLVAVVRRRTVSRPPHTGVVLPPKPPTGLPEVSARPPERGVLILPGVRAAGGAPRGARPVGTKTLGAPAPRMMPGPEARADMASDGITTNPVDDTTLGAGHTAVEAGLGRVSLATRKGVRRGGKTSRGRQADDADRTRTARRSANSLPHRGIAEAVAASPTVGVSATVPSAHGPTSPPTSSPSYSTPVLDPTLAAAGIDMTNAGWGHFLTMLLNSSRVPHTGPYTTPAATAREAQAHRMPCPSIPPASDAPGDPGLGVGPHMAGKPFVDYFPTLVDDTTGLPLISHGLDETNITLPQATTTESDEFSDGFVNNNMHLTPSYE